MSERDANDRVRLFVAVTVPQNVIDGIASLLEECRRTGADVRWVRPEAIHMTLVFLGPVRVETVAMVVKRLRAATRSEESFSVDCRGVGAFPNVRNPRVWWVGIPESDRLRALARAVREGVQGLGRKEPHGGPFRAHLTIGRVRSGRGAGPVRAILERFGERDFGTIPVDRVALIKSELRPDGARYTELASIALEGGRSEDRRAEEVR